MNNQNIFVKKIAILILYAYELGYTISFGEAWAYKEDGHHKRNSYHYDRLAIDLNLFRDGKWLKDTQDHLPLGEFWESIGGTWGGRFKNPDGNHYSYGE